MGNTESTKRNAAIYTQSLDTGERSKIKVEFKAPEVFVGLVTSRVLLTAISSEALLLLPISMYVTEMLPPSMQCCVFRY